jgi:hypothetical protein
MIKVVESIARNLRELTVIYYHPRLHETLINAGFSLGQQQTFQPIDWVIYTDSFAGLGASGALVDLRALAGGPGHTAGVDQAAVGASEAPRPRRKGKRAGQELDNPPQARLLSLARRTTRQGYPHPLKPARHNQGEKTHS